MAGATLASPAVDAEHPDQRPDRLAAAAGGLSKSALGASPHRTSARAFPAFHRALPSAARADAKGQDAPDWRAFSDLHSLVRESRAHRGQLAPDLAPA